MNHTPAYTAKKMRAFLSKKLKNYFPPLKRMKERVRKESMKEKLVDYTNLKIRLEAKKLV